MGLLPKSPGRAGASREQAYDDLQHVAAVLDAVALEAIRLRDGHRGAAQMGAFEAQRLMRRAGMLPIEVRDRVVGVATLSHELFAAAPEHHDPKWRERLDAVFARLQNAAHALQESLDAHAPAVVHVPFAS